uniref:Uncharacterized protein n=1 Tax=Ditylenchus dipsaci TaxID=166011 RepID=A0A915E9H9_9BILA
MRSTLFCVEDQSRTKTVEDRKRHLPLVAPQAVKLYSSSPAKPWSMPTASHPGLQLRTHPSSSSSSGPGQSTEVKQPDVLQQGNRGSSNHNLLSLCDMNLKSLLTQKPLL